MIKKPKKVINRLIGYSNDGTTLTVNCGYVEV